ncbi:MAG: PAS domain S-box protein, partial [Herminiimonas sp.]|nr:PAS domain S-box protein [Herminiimonas sp.]
DEVDRAGVRGLYSFKRLGATPWVLLAFYPDAEAFSVVAGLQRSAFLLVLLVIAVIGPVAWLFVRHQLEPLQELQSRVLAIARQPTLALMPQVFRDDEIGALAMSFNDLMRERLFAEARYQTGAEELRAATNSGLDAFFIFQAARDSNGLVRDFTIRYLNTNAETLIGVPLAAMQHKPLRSSLPGHFVTTLFDKYVQVLRSGEALQEEVCVDQAPAGGDSPPNGAADVRWFLHQIVPQADGVALTTRDITDRKRGEIEIRSNRAFLQSLTDHLPMLFYAKRIDAQGQGRFVTWNRAAEEITGYAGATVIGKAADAIFPVRVAAASDAHDRMILANPVPLETPEMRFYRPDGTLRYLRVMAVPIFDDAGQVEYIIGIGDDITERRQIDLALRTNRAEMQAVNDSSPLGLFMTDLAGNCTYVNRTFEMMSGFAAERLVGDSWFGALHADDQEQAIEEWVGAIQRREPFQGVRRFLHDGGRIIWGSFKAVPIVVDQQITGYVGSVDDITARIDAEAAARVSDQRLRLVADNIPALISYLRSDQRFEFGNRKYQRAYGLVQADIAGMRASDVLGPDVYAQSVPYIEGALQGTPAIFERLVTHTGELRWERVSYVPDVAENGVTSGFFSLVEDITELKQAQHTFAKSEMRLRMITDNLPALIAYIDRDERYRFCNGYYENIVGLKPEKILGRKVVDVVGDQGYLAVARQIDAVLQGERLSFERRVDSGGVERHLLYDYIPDVGLDGNVIGFYSMVLDISARKQAELKQAAGEKLLRTLTDNLPALVSFIDHEERFQFNNQVHAEWLDKPLDQITGRTMLEIYGPDRYQRYKPYFDQALKGEKVEFEFEAPRDGVPHFFRASYAPQFDDAGNTTGVCSMISDITALKQVENQLRILARFDSLTGLPNRNQFDEKLAEAIARSSRSKRAMAVMFLDIDHFKDINDTIGHHGGDEVLREFSQRLQRCVRKTDTVSRLAGDEFTIILEGLQVEDETTVVADKIIEAMREDFHIGEARRNVTTSIGIAVRRPDETDPVTLLRRADEALYMAKSAGRNTFESQV